MWSKPTISTTDMVSQGPHQTVDGGPIDQCLEAEYRAMLNDADLEREAVEWIEFVPDEELD